MDEDSTFWVLKEVLKYIKRDRNKIALLSTCRTLRKLFMSTTFTDIYDYDRVKDLPFRENLKYIQYISNPFTKAKDIPEYVTHIHMKGGLNERLTGMFFSIRISYAYIRPEFRLPTTSLVLVGGDRFLEHIEVADNIIHLRVSRFVETIKGKNITHLTLGKKADIPDWSYRVHKNTHFLVPPSVLYLRIHCDFIHTLVAMNAVHIKFAKDFYACIKNYIMKSVTHLKFHKRYKWRIKGYIPRTVVYLKYQGRIITGDALRKLQHKPTTP